MVTNSIHILLAWHVWRNGAGSTPLRESNGANVLTRFRRGGMAARTIEVGKGKYSFEGDGHREDVVTPRSNCGTSVKLRGSKTVVVASKDREKLSLSMAAPEVLPTGRTNELTRHQERTSIVDNDNRMGGSCLARRAFAIRSSD